MMLFLIEPEFHIFCRLFSELPIGSDCGLSCFLRVCGNLWILDATDWRWSLGISSARLAGGVLDA